MRCFGSPAMMPKARRRRPRWKPAATPAIRSFRIRTGVAKTPQRPTKPRPRIKPTARAARRATPRKIACVPATASTAGNNLQARERNLMKLQGKKALVTGADSGIGQAIARAFGREGAHVAVHYHSDKAGAEQTAADVRA